jgi:hypothetical protein
MEFISAPELSSRPRCSRNEVIQPLHPLFPLLQNKIKHPAARYIFTSNALRLIKSGRIATWLWMNTYLYSLKAISKLYVRFEVLTVVTMKNAVFWTVMPCGSCENRRFAGMYCLHHQSGMNQRARNSNWNMLWRNADLAIKRSVLQLLVIANAVPSSLIHATLMMEAIRSPETSVLTRATRRDIPEDGVLHSHGRENLKSYIVLTGWAL